jgi:hypothetical protein
MNKLASATAIESRAECATAVALFKKSFATGAERSLQARPKFYGSRRLRLGADCRSRRDE